MANQKKDPGGRKIFQVRFNLSWLYFLLLVGIGYLLMNSTRSAEPEKIEWADVQSMIQEGDVAEITFVRNDYKGEVKVRPEKLGKYTDKFRSGAVPKRAPQFYFLVSSKFDPETSFGALNEGLPVESRFKVVIRNEEHIWMDIFQMAFPLLLFILFWVWMFRGMNRGAGGGPGAGGFNPFNTGKSTAREAEKGEVKVTFKDVAGLYGAKEEVMEIVDFLKNPQKYTSLGGKIPKGALLVGPPGTGKTLLAKAVAGEANVPFFSISGSDFVEMFVGVGASRVRDLFRQAKEKAPCIVFIDEIDAVGRARAKNGGFSSNDERENTLNQLLTEMDGFGTNSGVIVLAATNRADILDQALMRAGRFDRQIHVELPELFMAKHTPGFSGADIANVCNEAALTAARRNHDKVMQQDFLDAVDRIIGGLERKSNTIMTPAEKRTTAYHEAGHALVGWLLPYADPVFKVSIIPRGKALGLTWSLPEERKNWSKSVMMDQMCMLLGGRVAEEVLNGEPSTGALNDLERMTGMAYSMVQYYGMSEKVGTLSFYDSSGARGYNLVKPYSEKTAELMDQEVKAVVDQVHSRTLQIIQDHKEEFMHLGALLLEKEVIFAEDIEKVLGPKVKPAIEDQFTPEEPKSEITADE